MPVARRAFSAQYEKRRADSRARRDRCAQCLSAKARHLAQYEMEDPRVLSIILSLTGWESQQEP